MKPDKHILGLLQKEAAYPEWAWKKLNAKEREWLLNWERIEYRHSVYANERRRAVRYDIYTRGRRSSLEENRDPRAVVRKGRKRPHH